MGAIIQYTCKQCGFVADDLAIGPSVFQSVHHEIVRCTGCDKVMTKPVDEENVVVEKYRKCHICGGTDFVIWNGICPKCGNKDLDFEQTGWWD